LEQSDVTSLPRLDWQNVGQIPSGSYVCGYCGDRVGPDRGYFATYYDESRTHQQVYSYICSSCRRPTFFDIDGSQWPGVAYGASVQALPPDVGTVYDEARRCMSASAYTTAVMAARKLLMHIAVEKGAKGNQSFKSYVDWLVENHYVPPGGEAWADQIRGKGNEANHEIDLIDQHAAEQIMSFVELLLKFVYEMPARAGGPAGASAADGVSDSA
jgi:Domain of unknown function (DUF4145)